MEFKVLTHKGIELNITGEITLEDFCARLNDRTEFTIPVGEMLVGKHLFKTIIPVGTLSGAYELYTRDGNVFLTDIPDFNALEYHQKINDMEKDFVTIGNIVIQRHNFEMIKAATVPVA
jgi:hypothetical protein